MPYQNRILLPDHRLGPRHHRGAAPPPRPKAGRSDETRHHPSGYVFTSLRGVPLNPVYELTAVAGLLPVGYTDGFEIGRVVAEGFLRYPKEQ